MGSLLYFHEYNIFCLLILILNILDQQLTCTIGDLFVAGTDTTSTALQWFIVLLINHPEVQNEMRKEINNVIGTSRYPCTQDKPKLPYTEAVLNEVLRFGCIAPFTLPHGLTKDFNYKGYVIPKGSQLMPNLHSVLYDPEIFDDPEEFRPTRFLDTERKLINLDKVLAFGLGNIIFIFSFLCLNSSKILGVLFRTIALHFIPA